MIGVSAPAGYGKSTLLAQWSRAEDRRVAWVSLDRLDDDPAVLLTLLATADARISSGNADLVTDMGGGLGVSVLGRAAPRLASPFRTSSSPFVLMLDDFTSSAYRPATTCLAPWSPGFLEALNWSRRVDPNNRTCRGSSFRACGGSTRWSRYRRRSSRGPHHADHVNRSSLVLDDDPHHSLADNLPSRSSTTEGGMENDFQERARRLRNAVEPVAGGVYFAPEAHAAYEALGFDGSPISKDGVARPDLKSYFTSRGACMGNVLILAVPFTVIVGNAIGRLGSRGFFRVVADQAEPTVKGMLG